MTRTPKGPPIGGPAFIAWNYWDRRMLGPFADWHTADAARAQLRAERPDVAADWFGVEAVTLPLRDALNHRPAAAGRAPARS